MKNRLNTVLDGMISGTPWAMARASYACSRGHGVGLVAALRGAIEIYFEYRAKHAEDNAQ